MILHNYNPKLAASVRGSVQTVDELVRVGSLIEKDWASQKDYFIKTNAAP